MEIEVVNGDLFTVSEDFSLAHCISKDCKMGKGIAKIFRNKFGRVDEIKACNARVGGVAPLKLCENRYIYNLVTKPCYFCKPTYWALRRSLETMRDHMERNDVTKLAMPAIGCGLDGLDWLLAGSLPAISPAGRAPPFPLG